ncbi:hypothetical protein PIROE2DRAFT_17312 [Piromyces sp. E2]|nr:hypothetical protein PIROE2DRAFT_17312 [Piromyces sp. E2]|eukprot:OUM57640.1 hypothetical protein PIROE2DRAFT_17312 [Piromyces sp. E2]
MKLLNKKLLFQLLIIKLVFGRPIDYEELERKEKSLDKTVKSKYILKVQQQEVNHDREELIAFAPLEPLEDTSNKKNSIQPTFHNKFNSIHRYHHSHHSNHSNVKHEASVKMNHDHDHDQTELYNEKKPNHEYIPDHYIVLFKKDTEDVTISQHLDKINSLLQIKNNDNEKKNFEIKHIYNMDGFKGYHGRFDKDTINLIKKTSEVLL